MQSSPCKVSSYMAQLQLTKSSHNKVVQQKGLWMDTLASAFTI